MRTAEIPVAGMRCEGCSRTLSRALLRVEGVHDADADHEAGVVRVRFDDAIVDDHQIFERIVACGFEVPGGAGDARGDGPR